METSAKTAQNVNEIFYEIGVMNCLLLNLFFMFVDLTFAGQFAIVEWSCCILFTPTSRSEEGLN